jgi:hypothetical protein
MAGYWEALESFRESDSMRMKYSLLFGPMLASGVKSSELTFETSTLAESVWSRVWKKRL